MRIEIRHLGIVKEARIDLKPLTVFVGPNNSGKTWTAYTLASIFGSYGLDRYVESYIEGKTCQYPLIEEISREFIEKGITQINIVEFADTYIDQYVNGLTALTHTWMNSFLNSKNISFDNLKISIQYGEKSRFLERLKKISPFKQDFFLGRRVFRTSKDGAIFYFYEHERPEYPEELPPKEITTFIIRRILGLVHKEFFCPNARLFPTERAALSSSLSLRDVLASLFFEMMKLPGQYQRSQAFSTLQNRLLELINSTNEPIPLISLFETIEESEGKRFSLRKSRKPIISIYTHLAKILEEKVLEGNVDFDEVPRRSKSLFFLPKENKEVKLEISVSSSMVKELYPLVLYLRDHAAEGDWLIIDEPEMNLHPAAQVQMIEFLAMLVKAGLKILITTHSPYMVDHLANLMKAEKIMSKTTDEEQKEAIKKLLYLEQEDSLISQEDVSVYLFEKGTARNLLGDDGTIDWGTFGNVSEDVMNIYAELLRMEH